MVLGVNGQDGSYLAEELLRAGYTVIGVGRQRRASYTPASDKFFYVCQDLTDCVAMAELLRETRPDAMYHMAAVHGAAGFFYEERGVEVLQVNTVLVEILLEYLRKERGAATLTCAGSAKQFGETPSGAIIHEASPRSSECLYSISKNATNDLIRYYRNRYGLRAGMIYYWNHESSRRQSSYFIPILVNALAAAVSGEKGKTAIRTLDFLCDWGDAEEYMHLTRLLAETAPDRDVIMATGRTCSARNLAESLFSLFGKKMAEHMDCLEITLQPESVLPPSHWKVDTSNLRRLIGKTPSVRIEDVCLRMLADRGIYPATDSSAARMCKV